MEHFGDRLIEAVRQKRTAVMVGIDPRPDLLPRTIVQRFALQAGASPSIRARAVEEFCSRVLEIVSPYVPAVKFQSAFFELYGAPGIGALGALLRKARRLGLVTVLDAKRGDIRSTSEAYAEAVFGSLSGDGSRCGSVGPIADAVTVSPYLGRDSLEPFLKYARQAGCGVFVLVRTSNPGSLDLQQAITNAAGPKVYELVAAWVREWSSSTRGQSGYGSIGAVVGGTAGDQIAELREALPGTWLLIPGYGVQGATAADIARGMDERGFGAIANSSRGILFPSSDECSAEPVAWEEAVEEALERMIDNLAQQSPAVRLRSEPARP